MAEVGMKAANGQLAMGVDAAGNAQFLRADGIPAGATMLTASSGNVAAASAAATFPAVASVTNYVTGFTITGAGATAASVVLATLVGLIGGTATFVVAVPAGVTAALPSLVVAFPQPIPASAANIALVLTLPSLGSGNTNAAVTMHGFKI